MAGKSTKGRKKVRLQSTESAHYYTTTVAPRAEKKLELIKYDPIKRKHVLYKEAKLASSS